MRFERGLAGCCALLAGLLLAGLPASAGAQCRSATESALPMPAANWLRSWYGGLRTPSRLAIDATGQVLVADPGSGRLVARAIDGAPGSVPAAPGVPSALSAGAAGTVWVADRVRGRVAQYAADGRQLAVLGAGDGEFGQPGDIALDAASGEIYVSDTARHRVAVYGSGGALLRVIGSAAPTDDSPAIGGQFRTPTGLLVAGDELLVADQLNYRIQAFDKQSGAYRYCLGTFRASSFFSPSSGPSRTFGMVQGMALDSLGRLYVADAYQGQIVVVDRGNGAVIGRIGELGDAPGTLRVPSDVVIDGAGRLIVATTDGSRLDLFALDASADPERFVPAQAQLQPAGVDGGALPASLELLIALPGYRAADVDPASLRLGAAAATLVETGDFDGDGVTELRAQVDPRAVLGADRMPGLRTLRASGAIGELSFVAEVGLDVHSSSIDSDGDGVEDHLDVCPGSAAGAPVDLGGCTVAQACPCADAKGKHWRHEHHDRHGGKHSDKRRDHRDDRDGWSRKDDRHGKTNGRGDERDDADEHGRQGDHDDRHERGERYRHGTHMACVSAATRELVALERLSRKARGEIIRQAARSACGAKR